MPATRIPRRGLALALAALPAGLGGALRARAGGTGPDSEAGRDGLTQASEAIHQEITFKAARHRVYAALTDAKQFDAVTRLSDAAMVTAPDAEPTSISAAVGGSFTLFGGYVTGRNLELLSDERLVQAWRARSWDAGDYSIVKIVLMASGADTRLVIDHRGFPDGAGEHLARGWYTHYWDPLTAFLANR